MKIYPPSISSLKEPILTVCILASLSHGRDTFATIEQDLQGLIELGIDWYARNGDFFGSPLMFKHRMF